MTTLFNRVQNLLKTKSELNANLNMYKRYKDYTMMDPYLFAENLSLAKRVDYLEGDVVECGVWRGGMSAGLATVLSKQRTYYLFDSFEGMPKPMELDGESAASWFTGKMPDFYYNNCFAEEHFAEAIMKETGKPFKIQKGWFKDSFPHFHISNPIAVLRLDADWYDSILLSLEKFYPFMVEGGIVLIDDYYMWDGCSRAVHDYFSKIKSTAKIYTSQNGVAHFFKPKGEMAPDTIHAKPKQ